MFILFHNELATTHNLVQLYITNSTTGKPCVLLTKKEEMQLEEDEVISGLMVSEKDMMMCDVWISHEDNSIKVKNCYSTLLCECLITGLFPKLAIALIQKSVIKNNNLSDFVAKWNTHISTLSRKPPMYLYTEKTLRKIQRELINSIKTKKKKY